MEGRKRIQGLQPRRMCGMHDGEDDAGAATADIRQRWGQILICFVLLFLLCAGCSHKSPDETSQNEPSPSWPKGKIVTVLLWLCSRCAVAVVFISKRLQLGSHDYCWLHMRIFVVVMNRRHW